MFEDLFQLSWHSTGMIVLSAAGIYITVITYTRVAGLRSFSKMAGFDFATTVAIGSLVASVTLTRSSLAEGIIGLAILYLLQVIVAVLGVTIEYDTSYPTSLWCLWQTARL